MKKMALVATNNLVIQEVSCNSLRMAGWEVVVAESSRETLELCSSAHFDLMVVDSDWPFDEGGDACEAVRQVLDIRPDLPIIVVSARADLREAVELLGVAAAVAQKSMDVRAVRWRANPPVPIARQPRDWGLNE